MISAPSPPSFDKPLRDKRSMDAVIGKHQSFGGAFGSVKSESAVRVVSPFHSGDWDLFFSCELAVFLVVTQC